MITPVEIERFWAKVSVPKEPGKCWEWTAGRDHVGYGRMKVGGTTHRAHRVLWLILHGELPARPTIIRHACDNPPCVNPDHLLLGSYSDNNRDMEERGRMSRGERHYNAKLTEDNVRAMRSLRGAGWTYKQLAEAFQLGTATVQQIVTRKRWRHVQ